MIPFLAKISRFNIAMIITLVAVMIIDLDHFTSINDRYEHAPS